MSRPLSPLSYSIRLLFFALFASGIIMLWEHYAPEKFQTNLSWAILSFFVFITFIVHFALTSEKDGKKFIVRFMLISAFRLLGYLLILAVFMLLKKETAIGFTVLFLIMYLLFSAFEVIALLNYFKK